jgi:hypothetical protein
MTQVAKQPSRHSRILEAVHKTTADLRNFRQCHLTFCEVEIRYPTSSELTWAHFRVLMRVTNPSPDGAGA